MDEKSLILNKDISPIWQGAAVVICLLFFNLVAFIVGKLGINTGENVAWEISLTMMLFFALGNAIFFLNAKDKGKYWTQSVCTYAILAVISVYLAKLISGFGLNESGSIKWIYLVFTFGYLVFVAIIGLMRRIVEIAIKQDKKLRGEE